MSESGRWHRAPAAALFALAIVLSPAAAQVPGSPADWHTIAVRGEYRFGTDSDARAGSQGRVSATVVAATDFPEHAGLLQQSIRADHYRGRRVRLSGYLRTVAADEARLWVRVDDDSGVVGSDFMERRAVRGTSEWRRYALVVDVPRNARGLTFGVLLNGRGEIFVDDLALDVVGNDCPTTGHAGGLGDQVRTTASIHVDGSTSETYRDERALPLHAYADASLEPENLDFEGTVRRRAPILVLGARP